MEEKYFEKDYDGYDYADYSQDVPTEANFNCATSWDNSMSFPDGLDGYQYVDFGAGLKKDLGNKIASWMKENRTVTAVFLMGLISICFVFYFVASDFSLDKGFLWSLLFAVPILSIVSCVLGFRQLGEGGFKEKPASDPAKGLLVTGLVLAVLTLVFYAILIVLVAVAFVLLDFFIGMTLPFFWGFIIDD